MKPDAKVPKSLRVGAQQYTVSFDVTTSKAGDCDGVTIMSEGKFILRPGLAPDRTRETLLHEILHGCFDQTSTGVEEDKEEERIIRCISPLLFQVLRDNPKLVRYLVS